MVSNLFCLHHRQPTIWHYVKLCAPTILHQFNLCPSKNTIDKALWCFKTLIILLQNGFLQVDCGTLPQTRERRALIHTQRIQINIIWRIGRPYMYYIYALLHIRFRSFCPHKGEKKLCTKNCARPVKTCYNQINHTLFWWHSITTMIYLCVYLNLSFYILLCHLSLRKIDTSHWVDCDSENS